MPLTAAVIRNAEDTDGAYKLADGGGLYLLVRPDGARYWRLKYRLGGSDDAGMVHKPKWMRWRTFCRLMDQADNLVGESDAALPFGLCVCSSCWAEIQAQLHVQAADACRAQTSGRCPWTQRVGLIAPTHGVMSGSP